MTAIRAGGKPLQSANSGPLGTSAFQSVHMNLRPVRGDAGLSRSAKAVSQLSNLCSRQLLAWNGGLEGVAD